MTVMNNDVYDARNYKPSIGDNFFFDTNIWLSVYGPIGDYNNWQAKHYSKLFDKLQKQHCDIYTDKIVISEYINRFARMEFIQCQEDLGLKNDEFKKFRDSGVFEEIAPEIAANLRKIIRFSKICNHEMDDLTLFEVADNFESGKHDFNDLIITEICRDKNLILVTDDGDFNNSNLKLVTVNEKILQKTES